jgi:hypothetical protein
MKKQGGKKRGAKKGTGSAKEGMESSHGMMADPMAALRTLQPAIDSGGVSLQRARYHNDLWMLVDYPGGELRTTYVVLENGQAQCIVQFVGAESVDNCPCLSIGYATMEPARNRGLASFTVEKAVDDMRQGLAKHGIRRFYLEAIVSQSNEHSQRVAERTLGPAVKSGTDHFSGEPIYQYLKLVS